MARLTRFLPLCLGLGLSFSAYGAAQQPPADFSWTWEQSFEKYLTPDAATQLLTKVVSEPENNAIHEFSVTTTDSGAISGLFRVSPSGRQDIGLDEILSGEVVLARAEGRDALMISCNECDWQAGGEVVLRYLVNGIWMTYETFGMDLKNNAGRWQLYTKDGDAISGLRLVANRIMGRLVGIAEIRLENLAEAELLP